MNFDPLIGLALGEPPVENSPRADKPSKTTTPTGRKLRKQKSSASFWPRNRQDDEPPAMPKIPEAFATTSFPAIGTNIRSANETDLNISAKETPGVHLASETIRRRSASATPSLPPVDKADRSIAASINSAKESSTTRSMNEVPRSLSTSFYSAKEIGCSLSTNGSIPSSNEVRSSFSVTETSPVDYVDQGLTVSGQSFMDLSDTSSSDESKPAFIHRLRRAASKSDVGASNETSPQLSSNSPSVSSRAPNTGSPGFRGRFSNRTNRKDPPASLRVSDHNSGSSAASLRSFSSVPSPLSSRAGGTLAMTARKNPSLLSSSNFDEFLANHRPQTTFSPRSEHLKRAGKSAPPIVMPRIRKYETVSNKVTRESIHGYTSFLSQMKPQGLPMPDSIDEDEGEWDRAVEWVRKQESERAAEEARAAKIHMKELSSEEARQAQEELDWQNKVKLAKRFIQRTSTAWVPKLAPEGLPEDEASRNAIAEALVLANKYDTSDPGLKELRNRFFASIAKPFSRSHDGEPPRTAPLPSRSGWSSSPAGPRFPGQSPIPSHHLAGALAAKSNQQSFQPRTATSIEANAVKSSLSPPLDRKLPNIEDLRNGLGIHMEPSTPSERVSHLNESSLAVPLSPGQSVRSMLDGLDESGSLDSPRQSLQSTGDGIISPSGAASSTSIIVGSRVSPGAASSTSVLDDMESRESLQSTASATLANARIFKVDRDSKIPDRFVPKRSPNFYQTISAARDLAAARMGMSPTASPTFSHEDYEVDETPTKQLKSSPSQRNMFKKVPKHPKLRAMISSMSMRSPDATEMITSPVRSPTCIGSPNANHPAFRLASTPSSPMAPSALEHAVVRAQSDNNAEQSPHARTSVASDNSFRSARTGNSSWLESAVVPATPSYRDRWVARLRQKTAAERGWREKGISDESPPNANASDGAGGSGGSQKSIPETRESVIETPTSPVASSLESKEVSRLNPALVNKLSSSHRRTPQDSPTPLNIKKFRSSPNLKEGLSLPPDSPAPLQIPKTRAPPTADQVDGQDINEVFGMSTRRPFSAGNGQDPFAKRGSSVHGNEEWPLYRSPRSNDDALGLHPPPTGRSPLENQFDSIITSWRHASATQEPLPSESSPTKWANVATRYQHVRKFLELPLLRASEAGKMHPNHPYHWGSINVMCNGIHLNDRTSCDTAALTARNADDDVKVCQFCQETCCYFGQQMGIATIQIKGRDQRLEELKNKARSHMYYLRGYFENGIEDYEVLMECGLCTKTFCPSCGDICQYPLCSHTVCKDCVAYRGGICSQHD